MKTVFPYHPYNIETSGIWNYERNAYISSRSKENWEKIEELYDLLQGFILEAGAKPFLKNSEVSPDDHYVIDFRNHFDEKTALDFFVCKGDFYDMQEPCLIKYSETRRTDFEKLFMLKLRQFKDKLHEVKSFLQFQLQQNFKNKLDVFADFLQIGFLQHPALVDERIVALTGDWANNRKEELSKSEKKRNKKTGRKNVPDDVTTIISLPIQDEKDVLAKNDPDADTMFLPKHEDVSTADSGIKNAENVDDYGLANTTVQEDTEGGIPKDYVVINGKFSVEETQAYFSFLYKEKDESGKPFLLEAEVQEIFKYGLAIPSKPAKKRYRLHYTLKFPKSIVEFCIYKFYTEHTKSHDKKAVLKFFASYIKDFEKALKSENDMQTWSDNVTGKRPRRMKFVPTDYLP